MILDDIIKKTNIELISKKEKVSYGALENKISTTIYKIKDVKEALKSSKSDPYKLIAEVKKASPSKGLIRKNFKPLEIAKSYEIGGANAISVLTEEHFFLGHLDYMKEISQNTSCVVLRKDFIIDTYQILEAKIYGADFILLIVKCLSLKEIERLYKFAISLNLEVLIEVHDKNDLDKALTIDANIIGINHRNLETFSMDMKLCESLIPMMPENKIKIAESGINNIETIKYLHSIKVDAFLIGEHFMRQDDITKEVKKLKDFSR